MAITWYVSSTGVDTDSGSTLTQLGTGLLNANVPAGANQIVTIPTGVSPLPTVNVDTIRLLGQNQGINASDTYLITNYVGENKDLIFL